MTRQEPLAGRTGAATAVPNALAIQLAAIERAADRAGPVTRIALLPEGGAEAFLLWAPNKVRQQYHVYDEDQTRQFMDTALAPLESTGADLLETLAGEAQGEKDDIPKPVMWNEPGLVMAGIAPGILRRWRARRAACKQRSGQK